MSGYALRGMSHAEKRALLTRLAASLCDVVEQVPSGQPVTCVRHTASVPPATIEVPRETTSENFGERTRS
jgi:hypothetical protein